jgi:cytoskeleton protein RodZ
MTDTVARTDTPQAPAARLGAELSAARRNLGWELPQLANSLRIRQSYLEAIETGRIADLPGTTYALGFVRAYATALGLPGEDMARRFRAEAEGVNGQPALRFPAPVPRRGVPAGALMLLGLVILAGSYGGWYWITEHRATPVETVPPIPDRLTADTQKSTPSPAVASLLPTTAPPAARPNPPPMPVPSGGPAGTVTTAPAGAAPAPQTGQAAPTPVAGTANPSQAPAAGTTSGAPGTVPGGAVSAEPATGRALQPAPGAVAGTAPPPAGSSRLVVRATADAWVTVKQPSGPPVLNKLMHAGETWSAPADKTGLLLTTGNAGGTEIDVDGAPIPQSLGTSGAVRRDVPLDPDLLKSGKLPPPKARAKPKPAEAPAQADQ